MTAADPGAGPSPEEAEAVSSNTNSSKLNVAETRRKLNLVFIEDQIESKTAFEHEKQSARNGNGNGNTVNPYDNYNRAYAHKIMDSLSQQSKPVLKPGTEPMWFLNTCDYKYSVCGYRAFRNNQKTKGNIKFYERCLSGTQVLLCFMHVQDQRNYALADLKQFQTGLWKELDRVKRSQSYDERTGYLALQLKMQTRPTDSTLHTPHLLYRLKQKYALSVRHFMHPRPKHNQVMHEGAVLFVVITGFPSVSDSNSDSNSVGNDNIGNTDTRDHDTIDGNNNGNDGDVSNANANANANGDDNDILVANEANLLRILRKRVQSVLYKHCGWSEANTVITTVKAFDPEFNRTLRDHNDNVDNSNTANRKVLLHHRLLQFIETKLNNIAVVPVPVSASVATASAPAESKENSNGDSVRVHHGSTRDLTENAQIQGSKEDRKESENVSNDNGNGNSNADGDENGPCFVITIYDYSFPKNAKTPTKKTNESHVYLLFGMVLDGTVNIGDRAILYPINIAIQIMDIHSYGKPVPAGNPIMVNEQISIKIKVFDQQQLVDPQSGLKKQWHRGKHFVVSHSAIAQFHWNWCDSGFIRFCFANNHKDTIRRLTREQHYKERPAFTVKYSKLASELKHIEIKLHFASSSKYGFVKGMRAGQQLLILYLGHRYPCWIKRLQIHPSTKTIAEWKAFHAVCLQGLKIDIHEHLIAIVFCYLKPLEQWRSENCRLLQNETCIMSVMSTNPIAFCTHSPFNKFCVIAFNEIIGRGKFKRMFLPLRE